MLSGFARFTNHHEANVLCDILFRYRIGEIAEQIFGTHKGPKAHYAAGIRKLDAVDVHFSSEFATSDDMLAFFMFNAEYVIFKDDWFAVDAEGGVTMKLSKTHDTARPLNSPQLQNDFWMNKSSVRQRSIHHFHEILFCPGCSFPTFAKEDVLRRIQSQAAFRDWVPTSLDKTKALYRIMKYNRHRGHPQADPTEDILLEQPSSVAEEDTDRQGDPEAEEIKDPSSVAEEDTVRQGDPEAEGIRDPSSVAAEDTDRQGDPEDNVLEDGVTSASSDVATCENPSCDEVYTDSMDVDSTVPDIEDSFDSPTLGWVSGETPEDIALLASLNKAETLLYRIFQNETHLSAKEECVKMRDARVLATGAFIQDTPEVHDLNVTAFLLLKEEMKQKVRDISQNLGQSLKNVELQVKKLMEDEYALRKSGRRNRRFTFSIEQAVPVGRFVHQPKHKNQPACRLFKNIGCRIEFCKALGQLWNFDNIVFVRCFYDTVSELSEIDMLRYQHQQQQKEFEAEVAFQKRSIGLLKQYWVTEEQKWVEAVRDRAQTVSVIRSAYASGQVEGMYRDWAKNKQTCTAYVSRCDHLLLKYPEEAERMPEGENKDILFKEWLREVRDWKPPSSAAWKDAIVVSASKYRKRAVQMQQRGVSSS